MKRIKLCDRLLPDYTVAEEMLNTITHGIGVMFGLVCLVMCTTKTGYGKDALAMTGALLYSISMIAVYATSAVYHATPPGMAKKVLQVLDHCTIYTLIAGTYSPITLSAFVPDNPALGWGLFAFQWITAAVCIVLNAIDLQMFKVISMVAYILMGWSIIFFVPQALQIIPQQGFLLLLMGGISYTLGAVLYGIGSKKPWFHGVFHIFVVIGSILQFLSVYLFIL